MRLIDSDHYADSGIETLFFPGGEPHARIPKDFGPALLWLKARTWADTGTAMCVVDAFWRQGKRLEVFCPYFPGARQDRSDGQTPLTLELVAAMFNNMMACMHTFDIHSPAGNAFIDHNHELTELETMPTGTVICPDHGALGRAERYSKRFCDSKPIIVCDKTRDFATGAFTGFKMPPLPGAGPYVIVDDICDGGGTFNLLADAFMRDGYGKHSTLKLVVSHGIFSKGLDVLHSKIEEVHTTDSWCRMRNGLATNRRLRIHTLRPIVDKILEEDHV